jgi:hypothetical protein
MLFLTTFQNFLAQGQNKFLITSSGQCILPHQTREPFAVPIATIPDLSRAVEMVMNVPKIFPTRKVVVEFERTAFGDFFGLVCAFDDKEKARLYAAAFDIPVGTIRDYTLR